MHDEEEFGYPTKSQPASAPTDIGRAQRPEFRQPPKNGETDGVQDAVSPDAATAYEKELQAAIDRLQVAITAAVARNAARGFTGADKEYIYGWEPSKSAFGRLFGNGTHTKEEVYTWDVGSESIRLDSTGNVVSYYKRTTAEKFVRDANFSPLRVDLLTEAIKAMFP